MQIIKEIYNRNAILANLGTASFVCFFILLCYMPFNQTVVLGINSVIKPMKFGLSLGIYAWTMAWLLEYLADKEKVRKYSWAAVITMGFEQTVITIQALRGELSHFNNNLPWGVLLFALMGIFILVITFWTLYMGILFFRQKNFHISLSYLAGIRLGILFFVVFSLFGGYISAIGKHTVGGEDGGQGLPFLNWSTVVGDLRIGHFFGIHALQLIPLLGFALAHYLPENKAVKTTYALSAFYFLFVCAIIIQALLKLPLLP